MKVKKGTILEVNHSRKGKFTGIALRDFDTEKEEFYPIKTVEYVKGMNTDWIEGEEIPCRSSLCKITVK